MDLPFGGDDFSAPRPETDGERQQRLAQEAKRLDLALASAAAGRVVSAASVRAWVNSWDTDTELPQPGSRR